RRRATPRRRSGVGGGASEGGRRPAGQRDGRLHGGEVGGGLELGSAEEAGRRVDAQDVPEGQTLWEQLADPGGIDQIAGAHALLPGGDLQPEPAPGHALDQTLGPGAMDDAADAGGGGGAGA